MTFRRSVTAIRQFLLSYVTYVNVNRTEKAQSNNGVTRRNFELIRPMMNKRPRQVTFPDAFRTKTAP